MIFSASAVNTILATGAPASFFPLSYTDKSHDLVLS